MSVIPFPTPDASPSTEPLTVVPGPDKPSGTSPLAELKKAILLEKEQYRSTVVGWYRQQCPNSLASDQEIWADIQAAEDAAISGIQSHTDYKRFVDQALARCNTFQAEENNGYPVVPGEAFMGATLDGPYGDALRLPDGYKDPTEGMNFSEAYSSNLIEEYLRIVEPLTDAPRPFHLATLLAVVGCAAARRSYFTEGGRRVYLNTWILLAGPSASRKSTAAKFGLDLFRALSEQLTDRNLRVNEKIGSIQALLKFMSVGRLGSPSRVVLDFEDEIHGLLKKAKFDSTLLDDIRKSYDCPPELSNNTIKSPTKVTEPFLSLLACGVDSVLLNEFGKDSAKDGFLNRWSLFLSRRNRKLPRGPLIDKERFNLIIKLLAQRLLETEGELTLPEDAGRLFDEWYCALDADSDDLLGRTTTLARKYACIYAILAGVKEVQLHHMRAGITLALYNYACARRLNSTSGQTLHRQWEDATLGAIFGAGGNDVKLSVVYRQIGLSSAEARMTAVSLEKDGSVKIVQGKRKDSFSLTLTEKGRERLKV